MCLLLVMKSMMDTNDCKTSFMIENFLKMRITETQVINIASKY
jgi:hypothetical protein